MSEYPKPNFTADAVVLAGQGKDMRLLLIERGKPPFQGQLALPGGFVEPFENPRTAMARELFEETSLHLPGGNVIPCAIRGKKGRDPRGWTITQPYLGYLPEPVKVKAADDAARAQWIPLNQLDSLAFDHGAILCEALGKFWQFMPTAAQQLRSIPGFGQPPDPPGRLTFFGGSFNPWHQGHSACIANHPNPELVCIVPDFNPFKEHMDSPCFWRHFRELSQKAAQWGASVFPGFCGTEAPNPTVSWFPWVKTEAKGLLMGEDSFIGFSGWTEADRLAGHLDHLYVVPRLAKEFELKAAKDWFSGHNPNVSISFLGEHPFRHLSSSQLRAREKKFRW